MDKLKQNTDIGILTPNNDVCLLNRKFYHKTLKVFPFFKFACITLGVKAITKIFLFFVCPNFIL